MPILLCFAPWFTATIPGRTSPCLTKRLLLQDFQLLLQASEKPQELPLLKILLGLKKKTTIRANGVGTAAYICDCCI